ncbi:hypothetical protein CR51_23040 [Caballeronia megalochromosomata]|nr:hypothetical protein CR51_23040 [Caballeronia megalochromosomata]
MLDPIGLQEERVGTDAGDTADCVTDCIRCTRHLLCTVTTEVLTASSEDEGAVVGTKALSDPNGRRFTNRTQIPFCLRDLEASD